MKSVILCEGGTDLALLQYFMEVANGWENREGSDFKINIGKYCKAFTQEDDYLLIAETGGCSNICPQINKLLRLITRSANQKEMIDKIVVITDRDEVDSLEQFISGIKNLFGKYEITLQNEILENQWISCSVRNGVKDVVHFEMLFLLIPFETTGALETFLLEAVSKKDKYDGIIVEKCNAFVDTLDCARKYLSRRRYKTKAKFDVYFSIRTPVEQFLERHNILKNIKWEEYEYMQESFKELKALHINQL